MEPVNIVCVGLSQALYGILEASFSKQNSFWVMGNFESLNEPSLLWDEQPQIIIVEATHTNICSDALYRFPRAKVISIEQQGKRIAVWRLVMDGQDLGEISSDELAAVIASMGRH